MTWRREKALGHVSGRVVPRREHHSGVGGGDISMAALGFGEAGSFMMVLLKPSGMADSEERAPWLSLRSSQDHPSHERCHRPQKDQFC